MNTDKKKYNLTVSPLWNTAGGNFVSLEITDEIFDNLQRVAKGGKLFVKTTKPEYRKNENSPHAYLEFMDADSVREFRAKQERVAQESQVAATPTEIL